MASKDRNDSSETGETHDKQDYSDSIEKYAYRGWKQYCKRGFTNKVVIVTGNTTEWCGLLDLVVGREKCHKHDDGGSAAGSLKGCLQQ